MNILNTCIIFNFKKTKRIGTLSLKNAFQIEKKTLNNS